MSVSVCFEGATEPSFTLTIPGKAPPSLNTILRSHWAMRRREQKLWRQLLWAHLCQIKMVKPFDKARIVYTRRSPRTLDMDNLVGGFKYIQDQLVHLGVIRDDTSAVIQSFYKQEKGVSGTEIKIWGEYQTQRIDVRKRQKTKGRGKTCSKKKTAKRSA